MKTTIITLVAVALLSVSNVFGGNKLYKNVIGNKESGIVTSTACIGSNDGILTPIRKNEFHYNADKSLKERISYKWDSNTKEWVSICRYIYEYNANGKMTYIAYSQWNKATKSWSDDIKYAMYIYDENNEYSSVKYLTAAD